METKFKFNSQICTSREQSERLLTLGLKPETADMLWIRCGTDNYCLRIDSKYFDTDIPAWRKYHSEWLATCQ